MNELTPPEDYTYTGADYTDPAFHTSEGYGDEDIGSIIGCEESGADGDEGPTAAAEPYRAEEAADPPPTGNDVPPPPPPVDRPPTAPPPEESGDKGDDHPDPYTGLEHFRVEHFSPPTADTAREFDNTLSALQNSTMLPRRTVRETALHRLLGSGPTVEIACSVRESTSMDLSKPPEAANVQAELRITIANRVRETSQEGLNPEYQLRTWRIGATDTTMTDTEFAETERRLQPQLSPATLAWLDQARVAVTATYADDTSVQSALESLLTTAPSEELPVATTDTHTRTSSPDAGDIVEFTWTETNNVAAARRPDDSITRQVVLKTAAGERYVYREFARGPTQLLMETDDLVMADWFRRQGFTVVRPGEGEITAVQRRAGIHQPTNVLMHHFNMLLRATIDLDN